MLVVVYSHLVLGPLDARPCSAYVFLRRARSDRWAYVLDVPGPAHILPAHVLRLPDTAGGGICAAPWAAPEADELVLESPPRLLYPLDAVRAALDGEHGLSVVFRTDPTQDQLREWAG